jgi:protein-tyrosine phosphatase
VVLDGKEVVANECFHFIEEALKNSESILVHSQRGQSRSVMVIASYFMKK